MKRTWTLLKQTVTNFVADDAMSLAGALAFYTALSLAPMLVLLLWLTSFLGQGAQESLVVQIESVVGAQAGEAIRMVISNAGDQPGLGSVAGIISLGVLLFSASGVFAQLQYSLNRVWDVEPKPSAGVWHWIRKRLLSFGMILAIAFLLMVSLGVSAVISVVVPNDGWIWQVVNAVISLAVFAALFAVMFKYLPDVKIAWRDVAVGAGVTALMFIAGKFAIGLYLGHSAAGSSYGAAGSLLVLLLWVYYSALLLFLGAEFTQVQARMRGSAIEPSEHAQWAPDAKRLHPA